MPDDTLHFRTYANNETMEGIIYINRTLGKIDYKYTDQPPINEQLSGAFGIKLPEEKAWHLFSLDKFHNLLNSSYGTAFIHDYLDSRQFNKELFWWATQESSDLSTTPSSEITNYVLENNIPTTIAWVFDFSEMGYSHSAISIYLFKSPRDDGYLVMLEKDRYDKSSPERQFITLPIEEQAMTQNLSVLLGKGISTAYKSLKPAEQTIFAETVLSYALYEKRIDLPVFVDNCEIPRVQSALELDAVTEKLKTKKISSDSNDYLTL